mmetsp:Transcript_13825/g.18471  ORF Transcript_13825/g.18471 Transcript_13825/m.18471 type:complete len:428 (+) Transcript_13825:58-1341(+)
MKMRCILLEDGRVVGGCGRMMVVLSSSGRSVACLETSLCDELKKPYLESAVNALPKRWQGMVRRMIAFRDAFVETPTVFINEMSAWRPAASQWNRDIVYFKRRETWTSTVDDKPAIARYVGLGLIQWRHAWQNRKLVRYSGVRPNPFDGVPGVCSESQQDEETLRFEEDPEELWWRFRNGGPLNLGSMWTAVYEHGTGIAFLDPENRIQVRPGNLGTIGDARFALVSFDRGYSWQIFALGCHGVWRSWSSTTFESASQIAHALKPTLEHNSIAFALGHLALSLAARTSPKVRLLRAPICSSNQSLVYASYFENGQYARRALAVFQCEYPCLVSLQYSSADNNGLFIVNMCSILQPDGLFLSSSSPTAFPPRFQQCMTQLDTWVRTWASLDPITKALRLRSRATALAQACIATLRSKRFLEYSAMLAV